MYPFLLESALKSYIWGGQRLKTEYGKKSDDEVIAESWELSCHKDGASVIKNGLYSGKTLAEIYDQNKEKLIGNKSLSHDNFPIMVKLIDAKQKLSIQVHPDDEYSLKNEGQFGKTEMWYIVDCEPDAYIYLGFNQNLTKDSFLKHIQDDTVLDVLNKIQVKKGDVFLIEPGTVHAICEGILIAEIQQNSNITYRVYDYNRIDADGKPRELHIEKALDVLNFNKLDHVKNVHKQSKTENILINCEYFSTSLVNVKEKYSDKVEDISFHCLLCLDGKSEVEVNDQSLIMNKGQTVFIPANIGHYDIIGSCEYIKITL